MQGADFSTRSASSISRWDETGCASDRFESPLRPRSPSSRTPGMYPHGMPNTPNGRETSPRIPLPPGRATVCLSSHVGSRPLNRWGQAALVFMGVCSHRHSHQALAPAPRFAQKMVNGHFALIYVVMTLGVTHAYYEIVGSSYTLFIRHSQNIHTKLWRGPPVLLRRCW